MTLMRTDWIPMRRAGDYYKPVEEDPDKHIEELRDFFCISPIERMTGSAAPDRLWMRVIRRKDDEPIPEGVLDWRIELIPSPDGRSYAVSDGVLRGLRYWFYDVIGTEEHNPEELSFQVTVIPPKEETMPVTTRRTQVKFVNVIGKDAVVEAPIIKRRCWDLEQDGSNVDIVCYDENGGKWYVFCIKENGTFYRYEGLGNDIGLRLDPGEKITEVGS